MYPCAVARSALATTFEIITTSKHTNYFMIAFAFIINTGERRTMSFGEKEFVSMYHVIPSCQAMGKPSGHLTSTYCAQGWQTLAINVLFDTGFNVLIIIILTRWRVSNPFPL